MIPRILSSVLFLVMISTGPQLQSCFAQHDPMCRGAFDIYFLLDRSTSVSRMNFQVQTVDFVHKICGFFISPKLMISLISFSTTATVDLKLTDDRNLIKHGLIELRKKIPQGNTNLHLGLNKAIDQIKTQGRMSASVIIVLTDGDISQHRQRAIDAANYARSLGAVIFSVGVDDYKMDDLKAIANKPSSDHVFTVDSYDALNNLITSIVRKACIEILSAVPSHICAGEKFDVSLTGNGFNKTDNITKVFCRFQQNQTNYHVTKPSKVTPNHLTCPSPAIDTVGSSVILQVSVNGKTFVSSNVTVTSIDCKIQRTKKGKTKDSWKAVLIFMLVLLFLALVLLWWFWKLLPCVKSDKAVPTASDETSEPNKKKWPTVDASFYGGGGVGGVKPVRVNWGDKGATEAGNKLSKPEDAKVIVDSASENGDMEQTKPRCFSMFRRMFVAAGFCFGYIYQKIASRRPIKGGKSKLYTSKSVNYRRQAGSTSNNNA